jgi:hypothetical protein
MVIDGSFFSLGGLLTKGRRLDYLRIHVMPYWRHFKLLLAGKTVLYSERPS